MGLIGAAPPDPGRQAERTMLAWRRTILSGTCAGLAVTTAAVRSTDWWPMVALLSVGTLGTLWLASRIRTAGGSVRPGPPPRPVVVSVAACGCAAVTAALIALTAP